MIKIILLFVGEGTMNTILDLVYACSNFCRLNVSSSCTHSNMEYSFLYIIIKYYCIIIIIIIHTLRYSIYLCYCFISNIGRGIIIFSISLNLYRLIETLQVYKVDVCFIFFCIILLWPTFFNNRNTSFLKLN